MRKKQKPDLNLPAEQRTLLKQAKEAFFKSGTLSGTAHELGISSLKARKLLITAGVYQNEIGEEIAGYRAKGMPIPEIAKLMALSLASVSSYLPYQHEAYKLEERSVNADKMVRYRERKRSVEILRRQVECGTSSALSSALWRCILAWQGQKFRTVEHGRDRNGAIWFTYRIKCTRQTGELTDELQISTREPCDTITRSSVDLALKRTLRVQAENGCVSGPKKMGQISGGSYLYAIFLKWGLITEMESSSCESD